LRPASPLAENAAALGFAGRQRIEARALRARVPFRRDGRQWEAAHFKGDELRGKVLGSEEKYEDALRKEFFGASTPRLRRARSAVSAGRRRGDTIRFLRQFRC
jgi:hypothetical protein